MKYLRLKKLGSSVTPNKANFKMFVAAQDEEPELSEVKLAGYFSTADLCRDEDRTFSEVDDIDKDDTEGMVVDAVRFALSAETKPKLKSSCSFCEDLVSKKVLN